jgi:spore maturation protein CgeB
VHAESRVALSYLGTFSRDRQAVIEELFISPARRSPGSRFAIAGAQYPAEFPWTSNIYFVNHLPAAEHPLFFCASRWTLNATRGPMVEMGYCPSGRLFEAAACGVPILSDNWEGLPEFFEPGEEIMTVSNSDDVMKALDLAEETRLEIGRSGRRRVMEQHTAMHRAIEFEAAMELDQATTLDRYIEV